MEVGNRVHEVEDLIREFIGLLDREEEKENGNKFKPNYISSCRALDGQRMEQIIRKLKEIL